MPGTALAWTLLIALARPPGDNQYMPSPPQELVTVEERAPACRYSAALVDSVCERLGTGETLTAVLADPTMPTWHQWFEWLRMKPEVRTLYDAAKMERAAAIFERSQDVVEATLTGEVAADRARVALDAWRWSMGKLDPRGYGERSTVAQGVQVTVITSLGVEPGDKPEEDAGSKAYVINARPLQGRKRRRKRNKRLNAQAGPGHPPTGPIGSAARARGTAVQKKSRKTTSTPSRKTPSKS